MRRGWRQTMKELLGAHRTAQLRALTRGQDLPRWGNLRRTQPFSAAFGADRGTPVDRYYIDRFFHAHRAHIRGDVLEIQSASYTQRYGHDVRVAHSLDINPRSGATMVCDLAESDGVVPSNRYDCFLLPSTPQHLQHVDAALQQALRIIKPGGTILATCAGFVPLIPDGADYWRLSAAGWREVTARAWVGCDVRVESHGNCLSAAAVMLGLALEELTPAELDVHDPRYPVVVTLWCSKPMAAA